MRRGLPRPLACVAYLLLAAAAAAPAPWPVPGRDSANTYYTPSAPLFLSKYCLYELTSPALDAAPLLMAPDVASAFHTVSSGIGSMTMQWAVWENVGLSHKAAVWDLVLNLTSAAELLGYAANGASLLTSCAVDLTPEGSQVAYFSTCTAGMAHVLAYAAANPAAPVWAVNLTVACHAQMQPLTAPWRARYHTFANAIDVLRRDERTLQRLHGPGGALLWQAPLTPSVAMQERADILLGCSNGDTLVGGFKPGVYVALHSGATGQPRWESDLTLEPGLADNIEVVTLGVPGMVLVYFSQCCNRNSSQGPPERDSLVALAMADGSVLWSANLTCPLGGVRMTLVAISGGTYLVAACYRSSVSQLTVIDPSTGDTVGSLTTDPLANGVYGIGSKVLAAASPPSSASVLLLIDISTGAQDIIATVPPMEAMADERGRIYLSGSGRAVLLDECGRQETSGPTSGGARTSAALIVVSTLLGVAVAALAGLALYVWRQRRRLHFEKFNAQ